MTCIDVHVSLVSLDLAVQVEGVVWINLEPPSGS
jgi:hypothetical protein